MGFQVVEIQPTPNPNAVKLVLDGLASDRPMSFFNAEAASDYPLPTALFAIEGVTSLLLLGDFITINKSPAARWTDITPKARAVLAMAKKAD